MAFQSLLSHRKKNGGSLPRFNALDRKLLRRTRARLLPSWGQIKYLPRFLTAWEKKTLTAAIAAAALGTFGLLLVFLIAHIITVPKDGGEYIEAMIGQPKYINPLFSSANDIDADITALVFSGLFRYNADQKLVPDLAAGYEVSANKKVYAISLREDVRWSDGEQFTADDVIFTFESIQNPEVGSPLLPSFQGVTVEKTGDYEVSFTLKEPFAPFLQSLTVGILPEHTWADIQPINMKLAKNNLQPVGSGPWVFGKLVKDESGNIQSYTLSRNGHYYRKIPYLKTVTFKFYSDYAEAVDALRSQTITAVSFVPKNFKDKISEKSFVRHEMRLPQYTALFFNGKENPDLKDLDLRLALTQGIDRDKITGETLRDEAASIYSPVLPGMAGYDPNFKPAPYDADAANAALDKKWKRIQPEEYFKARGETLKKTFRMEIDAVKKNPSSTPEMVSSTIERIDAEITAAVRKEMNSEQTFYRQDKNGNTLALAITTADTPEYTRVADEIIKMWRLLGVQASVIALPSRQIAKENIKKRDYQILLYGEIVGSDPDLYPFWHSSQVDPPGLNLSMFVDRNADKLLEEARASGDNKTRADLYKKFQELWAKDMPAAVLYTPFHIFAVNRSIRGIELKTLFSPSDRYNNLSDWYTKTKWEWQW